LTNQDSLEPPHRSFNLKRLLLGTSRNLKDPGILHKLALIPFFAWIGLGADGLSSSSYGPEEAYRSLGSHSYLTFMLIAATLFTVSIISYSYTKLIEQFPGGGGGYVVATKLLGSSLGVISGSALFVDYILTITVSIASGGDALFSLLPVSFHIFKLPVEFIVIGLLTMMNLRGVKESVLLLMPVFIIFVITHILLISTSVYVNMASIPVVVNNVSNEFHSGLQSLGFMGLLLIFFRAYSLGGGTYTGIEAVSNGVGILKDPKVKTAKKTMLYMAASLAVTAGGLFVSYVLTDIKPVEGQTLNAVLSINVFSIFNSGIFNTGSLIATITIISEAVLLLVAAQTGFIDGPRVLSNMAIDGWFPKRFAFLSDRLTIKNGILVIGIASIVMLLYTSGHIGLLVVMYSINVFLTFSLSQLGMMRFWKQNKKKKGARKNFIIHMVTFVLCFLILVIMAFEKFTEGAWVTVIVTIAIISLCFAIRNHYFYIKKKLNELDVMLDELPEFQKEYKDVKFDKRKPTAVILVERFSGLGMHIFLNIIKNFRNSFHNVLFVSVGTVDSDLFKNHAHLDEVTKNTTNALEKYKDLSYRLGFPADYVYEISTDVVETAANLCMKISKDNPKSIFFLGELIFDKAKWYHRILHNQTSYAIFRKIRYRGLPMVLIPAKILG
jgi:amino acid transporter